MTDPRPLMVRHSIPDDADFVHEVHIGKLVQVRRNAPRGASVVDLSKFEASLARADAHVASIQRILDDTHEDEIKPPEPWAALGIGLIIGTAIGFSITFIIVYCAWVAA